MAKHYESQTVFNYNLEQVLQGFWRRYPNPYSLHVLSEDTVEREIRADGKLYSKRLITKTNKLPKWAERVFSHVKQVCVVEESVVDMESKTLTTYTRNIGLNKIMVSDNGDKINKINFACNISRVLLRKSFIEVMHMVTKQWLNDQHLLIRMFSD